MKVVLNATLPPAVAPVAMSAPITLPPAVAPVVDSDGSLHRTTLHLSNLPVKYTRDMLLSLFDNHGFGGQYDFIYVPLHPRTRESLGIAFINLIDCTVAAQFWDTFQGFSRWWFAWCEGACQVSYSTLQGLEANIEFYRNSPLNDDSVSAEFKPTIFSHGLPCGLPPRRTFEQGKPISSDVGESEATSSKGESGAANGDCGATSNNAECGTAVPPSVPKPSVPPEFCTTVMLRNVPAVYTREMLLGLFDNAGFAGRYNFILLPLDFKSHLNQGYAHVNLVDSIVAAEFWDHFNGFSRWWRAWCKEVCEVAWSPLQGLEAHIERYRNSPLMHHLVPDEFRPAIFNDGLRSDFPLPNKKVRAPRIRRLGLNEIPSRDGSGMS